MLHACLPCPDIRPATSVLFSSLHTITIWLELLERQYHALLLFESHIVMDSISSALPLSRWQSGGQHLPRIKKIMSSFAHSLCILPFGASTLKIENLMSEGSCPNQYHQLPCSGYLKNPSYVCSCLFIAPRDGGLLQRISLRGYFFRSLSSTQVLQVLYSFRFSSCYYPHRPPTASVVMSYDPLRG